MTGEGTTPFSVVVHLAGGGTTRLDEGDLATAHPPGRWEDGGGDPVPAASAPSGAGSAPAGLMRPAGRYSTLDRSHHAAPAPRRRASGAWVR